MFINKDNIDARFKKFGLIDNIRLHVPHNAIFQIAEIIYEDAESIKSFYQGHWSLFVKGECVRIFPATMTNEERAARQQHTAILRNLPTNIHAIDLHSIYSEINAVSIGLPRYTKSYQTKPWAYIAFKSEEAMHAAIEISCSFNGRNLIWTTLDLAKNLCVRCSSPDHKSKECDAQESRGRKRTPRDKQALYNRYNIPNRSNNNRSRNNNNNNNNNRNNWDRSRSASRSRSRSSSRNNNKFSTLSSQSDNKKKVIYADAAGSSLDQSVHSPNNRNNKGKATAYSNDKPALDHSAFEKIVTTVTALNKNFDVLQNDYKQWKLELQQMNQRISNIEKAINISPPPPSTASKNVAKSSQHPSKQYSNHNKQQQQHLQQQPPKPSSASSSSNNENINNSSIADS